MVIFLENMMLNARTTFLASITIVKICPRLMIEGFNLYVFLGVETYFFDIPHMIRRGNQHTV